MAFSSIELSRRQLAEFVSALRRLRQRAGQPTYRVMARSAFLSASSLYRVQQGRTVPTLSATLAFVRACGGDEALWEEQHAQLISTSDHSRRVNFMPWRGYTPNAPDQIDPTSAAFEIFWLDEKGIEPFALAMRRLRTESGMTLSQISKLTRTTKIASRVGERGIPVSTLGDLCSPRHGRIPTKRTLEGFLLAIGAPAETIKVWEIVRQWLSGETVSTSVQSGYAASTMLVQAAVLAAQLRSDFPISNQGALGYLVEPEARKAFIKNAAGQQRASDRIRSRMLKLNSSQADAVRTAATVLAFPSSFSSQLSFHRNRRLP